MAEFHWPSIPERYDGATEKVFRHRPHLTLCLAANMTNADQHHLTQRFSRVSRSLLNSLLFGLFVTGLKRVRIGRVNLGHLPVGQWRYLAPHEAF